MRFSIAIATYNRLSLLRRAIGSALAQTIPCEVVVVDDCSSDGTEAYVQSLSDALRSQGDDRLVYYRNAANMGHAGTMNASVKIARGDWIKPLDDDDYLAPNCIEEMEKAIALHPRAVICSCQAIQVNLKEVELSRTRKMGPGKAFYIPQEDIHYGMLLEFIPFGTPAQVAFSRDAFFKTGGWDSSFNTNCDDIDSWIKIAQFGDAIFINQCLAYRTLWPDACNQKISLQKRLETNILMKEKIYPLVSDRHRDRLPSLQDIRAYLQLHWSIVALKHKRINTALHIACPAVSSAIAWQLLIQAILARKGKNISSSKIVEIQKVILV